MKQTHEAYITSIVEFAAARLSEEERQLIDDAKIVYGAGKAGLRGVTYFNKWENGGGPDQPHSFVEICAFGEVDAVQIAGTTLHELAHVIAGFDAGHGKGWKQACKRVGLRFCRAAGQAYRMASFDPDVRMHIASLDSPIDGKPVHSAFAGLFGGTGRAWSKKAKPCGASIGVRGGKSRGTGSGSRLQKVFCPSCGYTTRITGKWISIAVPDCPNPECKDHGKTMTVEIKEAAECCGHHHKQAA